MFSFKCKGVWPFKFLIIHLVSFQMAFGAMIVRIPAGPENIHFSINELREKIEAYEALIHGKDSQPKM